ncbi:FAD:protein FMN transferase [Flavilitoribacter nigricans]|uniref:FAD:protein FMN transferase n=1 Tax=Flavilitoribacter nigricans (strain ATCC 23147 / DSM 23189 / NBRC 102662 / NCIMB 1420 / SS-2) TaxID=1122177 RepID=A0A2D0NBY1_FLAN2|nr:FAD:protein FMN transferase [Flavilitoribacter nigricans]PHN06014.1 hypothetical protein CRP01_13675 [Flavilitoribacter nigricans DSM 23189 = NBRC 102662]
MNIATRNFPLVPGFFLGCLLLLSTNLLYSQTELSWETSWATAKEQAAASDKVILLNFSGSDWCAPCIKMKQEIFGTEVFRAFAADHLVLLNADFPRRRKNQLSAEQQAQNEQLAEQYNRKGSFPMTVLLRANGSVLTSWEGLPSVSAEDFVKAIRPHEPETKAPTTGQTQVFKRTLLLMGSRFVISVVGQDQTVAEQQIDAAVAEIQRIEHLISSWDETSQTSEINRQAGIAPVKVDTELLELIRRSQKISEITQGAFDISFGSIDKEIWHFDGTMTALPAPDVAKQSVRLINYRNIILDEAAQTIFLKDAGMRIGFGAIGKGYAAEKAKAVLVDAGVTDGIVNAGGDLTVWGHQPDGSPWTIGIANPENKLDAFSYLEISNSAVVTSGNYEKFVEIDGKRYTHIIDPRTGYPVSGLKSVTIICPNAEMADALATSVFVLGKEIGLDLINQMQGVHAILVDDTGEISTSTQIELH